MMWSLSPSVLQPFRLSLYLSFSRLAACVKKVFAKFYVPLPLSLSLKFFMRPLPSSLSGSLDITPESQLFARAQPERRARVCDALHGSVLGTP